MEKTSSPVRWWDWASIVLMFILLETLASRLVVTNWTPFLYLTQNATYMAFVVGTALGYSRFSRRIVQWLSPLYMFFMLPLQWTLAIDQHTSLEEQLLSVAGRLYYSTAAFLARQPVEDPLFFVIIMTVTFWFVSAWTAFALVRNQNYLTAVLPPAIGLLIIQNYDHNNPSRLWFMAFYALIALLLLGRLHFLQNRKTWRERRVFLSPDNSVELTSSMAIAAGLIILISWTIPASLPTSTSAVRTWNRVTKPWRDFTNHMQNAVSALESPSGSKRAEFFGSELPLGRGFPLADTVMFTVKAPEVPFEQRPPRYYWQGRTYNLYTNGQWYSTGTIREEYAPSTVNPFDLNAAEQQPAHFVFSTGGDTMFSLLYSPIEPIWISRPGLTFSQPADEGKDLVAWHAFPWLRPGETYQVDAILKNPNVQQLEEAGTDYPDWVKNTYLQLPQNFSPKIQELAQQITANSITPFEKASAITSYLRDNIEYAPTIPAPPSRTDALEWVLFEYKKGFCVYYASADVLMLRSLGIPARMAVGFAQGERDGNDYVVRKVHAHAWPEAYFPGIGWVEFEPTGNQPTLDRPLPPRDPSESGLINPSPIQRDEGLGGREPIDEELPSPSPVTRPISPLAYVIPLVAIALVSTTLLINRRYPLATHVPVLVRASIERTGFEVPKWVYHWEYWGHLSPIEKAFESINFGLRALDKVPPVHTTPSERANKLMNILPQMSAQIKVLLDEHQTSLYTSRVANVTPARRAAFEIRKEVILERLRNLLPRKLLRS